jgi:hypothetical protein
VLADLAAVLTVLQHLGSDLNGRRCHSDDGAFFVHELSCEEAHVAAASHNVSLAEQAT